VSVTGHLIRNLASARSRSGVSSTVFPNLDASIDLHVFTNSAPVGYARVRNWFGAEASVFDLSDTSTGETLFAQNFPLVQKRVGVPDITAVSPMLPEFPRNHHALRDGDKTVTHPTRASTTLGATRKWSPPASQRKRQ
jgi:hypothetical protein